MQKPMLPRVELVPETALQSLACVIESLLRIADAIQQLAAQRTRATVDLSLKVGDVRHNQFRRTAWGRCAQVRDEIADGEINFVTDRLHDRHVRMENCAGDDLF